MNLIKGYQTQSEEVLFYIDKNDEYIDSLEVFVTLPRGNFMESLKPEGILDILAGYSAQPVVNNSYFSELTSYKNTDGQVIISALIKEPIKSQEAYQYEEAFVNILSSYFIKYLSSILN